MFSKRYITIQTIEKIGGLTGVFFWGGELPLIYVYEKKLYL